VPHRGLMTRDKKDKNSPEEKIRDTEVPPAVSVPPPPFVVDDDEPIETEHTQRAQAWGNLHPWLSRHRPRVMRVLPRGESELYFDPAPHFGSPYGTWNGGAIKTGCVAAAQMAATAFFEGPASLLWASASFIAPATLDMPLRFSAEYVKHLSSSRILLVVTWYQQTAKGSRKDAGTMMVALAKAKGQLSAKPAIDFEPYGETDDNGEYTVLCKQLVDNNPYFSWMGVNITSVTETHGAVAHLEPDPRMLNTHGTWADGVLGAVGDALVCYACVPTLGEKPATVDLRLMRIAQAPGNARLFGKAQVLTRLPSRRNAVHGEIYYLAEDGNEETVGLLDAIIVGT
jgi:acyl-coenzyme A thioesterase PaaI-like protein